MRAHRAPANAGFTLVEALVALAVLSLIAAGSVALLSQAVGAQARVSRIEAGLRALQTTRALLAADLAQLTLREVRDPAAGRLPSFRGEPGGVGVAFVRAAAEPDGRGGADARLAHVSWRLEDGRLIRRSRTALDPGPEALVAERVLLEGVEAARFAYFDGRSWLDEWAVGAGGGVPPRAVALILTLPRYGEVRIDALVGLGP